LKGLSRPSRPEVASISGSEEERIEVTIRYRDVEKKSAGDLNSVIRETLKFLTETVPNLELISKISMNFDVEAFLTSCEGIFAATPEGVVILAPTERLADRDLILLHLAKIKFGFYLKKYDMETILINDILSNTKKSAGTIAGRLSEMVSEGLVERVGKGEYKVTTYGADRFLKEVLPQLKK